MHKWGDEDVDWKGLGDCCDILWNTSCRWGRIGGQIKEKYGTLRFYASFTSPSLHNLIYPGYYYYRFPDWLLWLDQKILTPVLSFFFGRLFRWWQEKWYVIGYRRCLNKYPKLAEEIISAADYPEILDKYGLINITVVSSEIKNNSRIESKKCYYQEKLVAEWTSHSRIEGK